VVDRPESRTRQVEGMVEAFSLNLTALSFIALFVAVFLVLNAVGLSVLRWRRDLGILRALGVSRRELLLLFTGEGALLGALGGALGVGVGVLLARGTLGAVSRTLSDLYLVRQTATVRLDQTTLLLGLGLGLVSAIAAAAAPALEAAATPPATTTREGAFLEVTRPGVRGWLIAGIAALLLAGALSWWTVAERRPLGGFASAFVALVGFALLSPVALRLGSRLLGAPVRRLFGVAGTLGARYVADTVLRSSVVIAAIMVAVGMTVAMSIMVGSFRGTVDRWITQTLRGDLYVEPVGRRENAGAAALPAAFLARARALPGVVAMDTYRGTSILHGGRIAFAAGIDFEVQRDHGHLAFLGTPARQAFEEALDRQGCIVTESFAHRHRVGRGDSLRLRVPAGSVALPVCGVFYDYSVDAGAVLVDRRLYARLWRDDRTESLALYLAPGADPQAVRRALLEAAGPALFLQATPNQALRARVLQVFDQTFRVTWALQAIAVVVSVLGVAGSLTALILQRGREIGVLRAVGALKRQVRVMVLVESGLLGAIGALLGCVAGVALSAILVHVINKQFFGWTVRWTLDPWTFAQAVLLMVVTACLAGLAPARHAAGRVAREAMRME
jgi:putative ABC transport system permease protein